jgi:hypothetical protein
MLLLPNLINILEPAIDPTSVVSQARYTVGFNGAQEGWRKTDVYLYNTLNVVGHIHLVILTGRFCEEGN